MTNQNIKYDEHLLHLKDLNNPDIRSNQSKDDLKTKEHLISIIIPLYNEEKTIVSVIDKISNHCQNEIIVVDDGTTDKSVSKVKNIKNKNIRIIKHITNKGYGAAIKTGIKHAKGDIIVTLDADGQHNPEDMLKLVEPIIKNKADLVIGSRYLGKCEYKVPLHIRFGEFIIKNSLWFLFYQRVGNNQSGYRAFSRNCSIIFKNIIFEKFGFSTELLFEASSKNFRIIEIPIKIYKRQHGASKIQIIKIIYAISLCFTLYLIKKINLKKIVPRSISRPINFIITNYLKKNF